MSRAEKFNNNTKLNNLDERHLLQRLAGLRDSKILPVNKSFAGNLEKSLINLHRQQYEGKSRRLPAANREKQVKAGFWDRVWGVYKFQSAGLLGLVVLVVCATTTAAAYITVPEVRENLQSAVQPQSYTTLAVQSNPSGAEVYLNNELVGTTPFIGERKLGSYELQLNILGYQSVSKSIELGEQRQDFAFEMISLLDLATSTRILTSSDYLISLPDNWQVAKTSSENSKANVQTITYQTKTAVLTGRVNGNATSATGEGEQNLTISLIGADGFSQELANYQLDLTGNDTVESEQLSALYSQVLGSSGQIGGGDIIKFQWGEVYLAEVKILGEKITNDDFSIVLETMRSFNNMRIMPASLPAALD